MLCKIATNSPHYHNFDLAIDWLNSPDYQDYSDCEQDYDYYEEGHLAVDWPDGPDYWLGLVGVDLGVIPEIIYFSYIFIYLKD